MVHLPAFRLERCGYDADELAGLIAEQKSAMRLVALTPAAVREGLRLGMTASEARALVPQLALEELDEATEREDRAALLRAFDALSDAVTFPWPDELALEVAHVARLFGGELGLAERAVRLAAELGHRSRAAVADDPLAAAALAIWATEQAGVLVAPPGQSDRLLAPLPLQALRPDEGLLDALRAVGVETIGQWAALDPAAVVGRYGPEAGRLHRVARGLQASAATLARPDLPETISVRAPLAGATTLAELHFVLPGLLVELSERLADRDLAVVRLRVVLKLEKRSELGLGVAAVGLRIGRPTRSPRTLERLLRSRLDNLVLEAPAEELKLEAIEVVPEVGWQPGLSDRSEATEPLPDLLARLSDQLGEAALFAPRLVEAWRPEAAWRPELFPPMVLRAPPAGPEAALASDDPVEIQQAFEGGWPLPRPTLLLPKPERVDVEVRGGRPARLSVSGQAHAVQRSAGPERLQGEWWSPATAYEREYWVVQVDDRVLWLFTEGSRWYLHGYFD